MATILADNNFKCIFLDENDGIPIRISLKFVPGSPTDNMPALVQVMAWPNRLRANTWINVDPVHLRIYADPGLGGDELTHWGWQSIYAAIKQASIDSKWWLVTLFGAKPSYKPM